MAMTKEEISYLAAGKLSKRRVGEIAALFMAWIDDQVTETTAIQALCAAASSSRNPNFVLNNAATWYAAFESDPPTITSITPNTGSTAGGTSVVIAGTNLLGATVVTFGGTTATSIVITDTAITCATPAKTAGAKDVVVTTPAGSVTSTGGYTYA